MSHESVKEEKPDKAKWWLVTWSTYGTWLPGDPRGFQTWRGREHVPPPKRFAKLGEETYDPEPYQRRLEIAQQISDEPVRFNGAQQAQAFAAVVEEIEQIKIIASAYAQGSTHAHLLAIFGELKIRTIVGRLKAAATRALNDNGFEGKRPWSKGCHMKSKATQHEYENALRYVLRHREEGLSIQQWEVPQKFISET